MSLATHSPLPPSLPDAIMQVYTESEQKQNPSVSCLNRFPFAFVDNRQIQDSGSVLFANASNSPITGGTFGVSLSCALFKQFERLLLLITCNLAHVYSHS
jgi:hypothetical protein